jgi:SAM-dependent methyltransferase
VSHDSEAFWEAHYSGAEQIWSGEPNATFVTQVDPLTPGTALDLGCGEGGDAIWLAQRGWQVTAVDISTTALSRGRRNAERAGVSDRITWERHELPASFPSGQFDLVCAQFLHSPIEDVRDSVFVTASRAVAPGGRLLVVSHQAVSWAYQGHHVNLPSPEEVLESLRLDDSWTVETLGSVVRTATGPDEAVGEVTDSVVMVRSLRSRSD